MIDTTSFMQITPPPVHRKMGVVGQPPRSPLAPIRLSVNISPPASRPLRTAQRPDIVKVSKVENADMVFRASRVFVDRSPPQDRRQSGIVQPSPRIDKRNRRPKSMFEQADEPLYATPVRAMNRSAILGTLTSGQLLGLLDFSFQWLRHPLSAGLSVFAKRRSGALSPAF
ncbi:hypothetical protein COOONC_17237 [Cooperia oncophora]